MFNFVKWFLNTTYWYCSERKEGEQETSTDFRHLNRGVTWMHFYLHWWALQDSSSPSNACVKTPSISKPLPLNSAPLLLFFISLWIWPIVSIKVNTGKGYGFMLLQQNGLVLLELQGALPRAASCLFRSIQWPSGSPQAETCTGLTRDDVMSRYLFPVAELNAECVSAWSA